LDITAGNCRIVLSDGANPCIYDQIGKAPSKHQLLIEFDDGSVLVCTVQMYSAVLTFIDGKSESIYHLVAKEKLQPLISTLTKSSMMLCIPIERTGFQPKRFSPRNNAFQA